MKASYDLTTQQGMKKAIADIKNTPLGQLFFPYLWAAEKVLNFVESGKAVERQSKAAEALIKAGKESGVKKMKITMDEQAGLHYQVPIEGASISASLGSKGKVTIDVEYF